MSDDDHTLLQNYVRVRSDAAFEAISTRYVDLVYSSALRLSGDRHLAEDVTQAVFLVLAEKAPQIKPPVVLPAWLLSVTRLTAANLRRSESTQRKGKEAAMNAQEPPRMPAPDEWEHIAPFLDDALAGLNDDERAAITLRYFQHSSLDDVGRQLGVSADAARKRVDRALEKLRRFFAHKGVTIGAAALPMLLASHAVHSAPAALAAAVPSIVAAAHSGAHSGSAYLLSKGTLKVMAITATKKTILLCAACVSVGLLGGALATSRRPTSVKPSASALASAADGETKQPPAPPPPVAPVAPAPPPTASPVPAAPVVNLLANSDAAADSVNGIWTLENGALRSGETAYARFEFPYIPPEDYDFTIDFTVEVAREDVVMLLSKNGTAFCWKMGMAANRFCAFEYIGSVKKPDQQTRIEMGKVFQPNQRCKATVQVRNGGVAAYMDDKLISSYNTDYKDLHQTKAWMVATPGVLGIGTFLSKVTVHSVEVTEVSGRGRVLRKEGETPPPHSIHKMLGDEQWAKAVDLMPLIDPRKDAVVGLWTKTGSALACDNLPLSRLEIPYRPPEEYDFKIVFSRAEPGKDLDQFVSQGKRSFQWCANAWKTYKSLATFQSFDRYGDYMNTTTAKLQSEYNAGQQYTSIVQVRRKSSAAYLDGVLISEINVGYFDAHVLKEWQLPTPGLLGLGSSGAATIFHKIELVEVTGKGTPTPTNPNKILPAPKDVKETVQPEKPPKPPANDF